MNTLKFKTNIKCGGCIAALTPHLNNISEISSWNVDTENPEKILTVEADNTLSENTIIEALQKAGYQAAIISNTI